jgi:4-hydroxy-3-polyprenylbenzoate decarboxylase
MCIDGTRKMAEETDDNYVIPDYSELSDTLFQSGFPEIRKVNTALLKKNIPCLIVSVEKNRKGHIKELHEQVCALKETEGIKMILYVEHTVDATDLPTALWRLCNNLDPKRDYHLCKIPLSTRQPVGPSTKYTACMGFDGTRKTREFDDFNRDWPNIIVADDETIKTIDAKWNELGIGKFIPSPSLKFKDQLYGKEAVVN